jgi:hypothetical protein
VAIVPVPGVISMNAARWGANRVAVKSPRGRDASAPRGEAARPDLTRAGLASWEAQANAHTWKRISVPLYTLGAVVVATIDAAPSHVLESLYLAAIPIGRLRRNPADLAAPIFAPEQTKSYRQRTGTPAV